MNRRAWYLGRVEELCYLVARGKLAAWVQVPGNCLADVTQQIAGSDCRYEVSAGERGWGEVWIYRRPLAGELLRALPAVQTHLPAAVAAWFMGTLLGYSVPAIEAYLEGSEGREYLREFGNEGPGNTGLVARTARGQGLALVHDDGVPATATLVPSGLGGTLSRTKRHFCHLPPVVRRLLHRRKHTTPPPKKQGATCQKEGMCRGSGSVI